MLNIYQTTNKQILDQIHEIREECWVNLINPTDEEIKHIASHLHIDEEEILSVLDEDEAARIETSGDYTLVIVDVPIIERIKDHTIFKTIPIAIFITSNVLLTVCVKEIKLLSYFLDNEVHQFDTHKKTRFLLQLLEKNTVLYLNDLRHINKMSLEIEQELRKSAKNVQLEKCFDLEKSLLFLNASIRSNQIVLEKLHKLEHIQKNLDEKELLEDITIENQQAIEMAQIYSGILKSIMDFYSTAMSNNLNAIMKILTSLTIVLYIPTLIASLFGMNVPLPFSDNAYALPIILFISLNISLILAIVLKKKNLF